MIALEELELTKSPQALFDNFNAFMLSGDRRIFNKLVSRALIFDSVKDIPGDIVECGVFKGTGLYTFLKLKSIFNANSSKKVIGFDFFDTEQLISSIAEDHDRASMDVLFKERNFAHTQSFSQSLRQKLLTDGFLESDFELVEGDVSLTSKQFVQENPGFKISLLYMDLDLEAPTYNTLVNLWDNVTRGGIVVFDEYGYHKWSESKGVDRFLDERNLEIKSLNFMCPTAYIKK